jgi:8-oxo-dGTP pyrophosphatase MutT (NUDIX family)
VQYAALPWRAGASGDLEVLIITSRETRRWVVPKGWPIRGLPPEQSAAREAYEEAGVTGVASKRAIGDYAYAKRLSDGATTPVQVKLFPLKVFRVHDEWPEIGQREKCWASPEAAAEVVHEPELKKLIHRFAEAWREAC